MVSIANLVKIFGEQRAVNDITFQAKPGQITGFLGPNGAGKSTTMKMATGYLLPSAGSISVSGVDVVEQPLRAKQKIGYLPEHNPLYLQMYVREFLTFIADAYGLNSARKRAEEAIQLVGLKRESNKKIQALSKGYRQRVGLAKALIHDPEVLILDEPTSGLDPNQLVEVRQVIKDIARDKTVILSTHIMQEVEAICDHVVIINRGQLVADDTLSAIRSGISGREGMLLEFEKVIDEDLFAKAGFAISRERDTTYYITSDQPGLRAELLKITADNGLPLVSLKKADRSLEQIFHQLTNPARA